MLRPSLEDCDDGADACRTRENSDNEAHDVKRPRHETAGDAGGPGSDAAYSSADDAPAVSVASPDASKAGHMSAESLFGLAKVLPGVLIIEDDLSKAKIDEIRHVSVHGDPLGITGFAAEELERRALPNYLWDDAERAKACSMLQTIVAGDILTESELKFRHKDGSPFVLRMDKLTRRLPNGHFLIIFHDVTAEVQLREERASREAAEATSRQFEMACAYLSHEIRNQLFPQIDVLERLRAEAPAFAEDIGVIISANHTVTSILNSILDLAKWDSGEFPTAKTLVRVDDLLRDVARFGEAKARGTPVAFRTAARVPAALAVRADGVVLKQAVTNLVSNALKFTERGSVTLEAAFADRGAGRGELAIVVRDTGRGLAPEQLRKVMMPFHTTRVGGAREGTGLGLPLARAMVETGHGGTLRLESAGVGRGVAATVTLPVRWELSPAAPERALDPLAFVAATGAVDVLVVDDSRATRRMLAGRCARLGLSAEEASDGLEALEKMRATEYSLVSMDNQMPGLTGIEATARARAAGYRGAVVLVSGDTFEPAARAAVLAAGVTAVLTKMDSPSILDAFGRLADAKA
mmetsp:Transcript_24517/g.73583  ORF Transcript_24517/g.73583 Transcript_24517/m.73583 type:complete len:581 (+) Transcript_24517:173-1915(+)